MSSHFRGTESSLTNMLLFDLEVINIYTERFYVMIRDTCFNLVLIIVDLDFRFSLYEILLYVTETVKKKIRSVYN